MRATTRRATRTPRERLTDVGNSRRFTEDHKNRLIYVPGPGWHAWDGRRWKEDNQFAPYQAAKETAHRIRGEAARIEDPKTAEKVFNWAISSESHARIRNMVDLAKRGERDSPGLVVPLTTLDARPGLISCANGTVNLKTGRIGPHRPSDYLTRMIEIPYENAAKAPLWLAFVDRVFDGDEALTHYVQRTVGYSLTGDTSEQVMFIPHGPGANGKSVFMETVAAAAGEWSLTASAETFIATRSSGGVPNDLARMRGARLVRVPETEDGATLARQIIKRITGGDEIAARYLFREWFEYRPTFKVWLVTNHLPNVPYNDLATWRRIRVIPFRVTIPRGERDPQLSGKLRDELPGILAWAIVGARAWYRDRLGVDPAAVSDTTDAYRSQQDTTGRFLKEETEDRFGAVVAKTELYAAYRDWCKSEELTANSPRAFYGAIRERGYPQRKVGTGVRVLDGLRLR